MPFSIHEYYKSIVLKLRVLYPPEESRAMANNLIRYFFHLSPVQRVVEGANIAGQDKIQLCDDATNKLLRNIPLQYVLGSTFFMDMEFDVNPSVLIPRPETEELVRLILKQYPEGKIPRDFKILDIGTGSGCIAIALKRHLPESNISAIDISSEALLVASQNAVKNNVAINFIHSDILDHTHWDEYPQSDLIVSNPPYVTNAEKELMLPNVLDHEPHTALFVPDNDVLVFYREIMAVADSKLLCNGSLWFEINEMFGDELKEMALRHGFKVVNIIFDIRGKSRFLQCRK